MASASLPNYTVNLLAQDAGDDVDDADITSGPLPGQPSTLASGSKSCSVSAVPDMPMSAKARGKQKVTDDPRPKKQRKRDHWTRWPLLLEDVAFPEWSLEDEVAVIVAQHMKSRSLSEFPIPVGEGDGADEEPMYTALDPEYDEEDPDPPFYVPYITATIANYLTIVLAALAAHIPARTAGFQNRIEPLGWRTVIDVLVNCAPSEFVNPKIVENVIKRMEAIYGPSIIALEGKKSTSFRAVDRINMRKSVWDTFRAKMDEEDAAYWKPSNPTKLPVMNSSGSQGQNVQPLSTSFLTRRVPVSNAQTFREQEEEDYSDRSFKRSRKQKRRKPNVGSTRYAGPSTRTHEVDVAEVNAASTSAITDSARPEKTESQATTRVRTTRVFNLPSEDVFME